MSAPLAKMQQSGLLTWAERQGLELAAFPRSERALAIAKALAAAAAHPDCGLDDCPCVRRGIDLMARARRQRNP